MHGRKFARHSSAAERFLSLAALVSVALSAVAIALAARRFLRRHLDGCAVMRCMGARQPEIVRLYLLHFVTLGVIAGSLGCMIGYVAQFALAAWLGSFLAVELPWPSLLPAGLRPGCGRVPAARFCAAAAGESGTGFDAARATSRSRFAERPRRGWLRAGSRRALRFGAVEGAGYALRRLCIGGFSRDGELASVALVLALLRLLSRVRAGGGVSFRYGVANLRRHALGNTIQVVALALGMMALLTLTLIRGDLLRSWQATLKPDAPNRFIVSIQPEQVQPLKVLFRRARHCATCHIPDGAWAPRCDQRQGDSVERLR